MVIPALASENYLGKNCLSCHQVARRHAAWRREHAHLAGRPTPRSPASATRHLFAFIVSLPVMLIVFLFIRRFVIHPLDGCPPDWPNWQGRGDLTAA